MKLDDCTIWQFRLLILCSQCFFFLSSIRSSFPLSTQTVIFDNSANAIIIIMKFIATTIVLLASTAVYAGESKLRLGRNLGRKGNRPVRPSGTTQNTKGFNGGYGKRCCRDYTVEGTCNDAIAASCTEETCGACNIENVGDMAVFAAGFPGCTWYDGKCSVCAEATDSCESSDECCSGLECDTNSTSTTYQTCITAP